MKTLTEAKHAVIEFLHTEDTICPAKQHPLVKFACDDENMKVGLIVEALKDFEKYEIVRSVKAGKDDCWVLIRPLVKFERAVTLTYETLFTVSEVLRQYSKLHNDNRLVVEASDIGEGDIKMVALIAQALLPDKPKEPSQDK